MAMPVDARAPLVVGVTGHRDLRPEDSRKLKEKIRLIFTLLRERYPATPIVLLSPLAEGADRLAAEVAIEEEIRLVVPLPMPQDLYELDFKSTNSLAEFYRLLSRSERKIPVPLLVDKEKVRDSGDDRNRQYQEMGKYIARESQILIALWDGSDSGKIGGTAQIVHFQLHGVPPEHGGAGDKPCPPECDLQPPELFPVYRIVTPRISNPNPRGIPFSIEKLYPKIFASRRNAKDYYDQLFCNLEEFNHHVQDANHTPGSKTGQSKRNLLNGFDKTNLDSEEALNLERYAVSDVLAQYFQSQREAIDISLHLMVGAAFVCFVCFAHTESHPAWLLLACLIILGLSFALYRYSFAAGLDRKSHDYRAIAEGSRVRFFWHLAGIKESVAENYLGKQRTELDWIRNGLRGWGLEWHMDHQDKPSPQKERLEAVERAWVGGQLSYFECASQKKEEQQEERERQIGILAGIFLVIVVCTMMVLWIHPVCPGETPCWLTLTIILADLSLIVTALLHHHTQQKAYAQHAKQFTRMKSVFAKARELILASLKAGNLTGVQACLLKLGQEALSENGDWVLLRRERPLELPPP